MVGGVVVKETDHTTLGVRNHATGAVGWRLEAPGSRSNGPWFEITCCRFEAWTVSFTPLCPLRSEDTLLSILPGV